MQVSLIRSLDLGRIACSLYFLFQQATRQGRLVCGGGWQYIFPRCRILRLSLTLGIGNTGSGVMERMIRFQIPITDRGQQREGPWCASGSSLTRIHLSVKERRWVPESDGCQLDSRCLRRNRKRTAPSACQEHWCNSSRRSNVRHAWCLPVGILARSIPFDGHGHLFSAIGHRPHNIGEAPHQNQRLRSPPLND
jgi:hypothetical protein